MEKLFKLNFEKTAISVLMLIVLISTLNIYNQFYEQSNSHKKINSIVDSENVVRTAFPGMLLKADELYNQGKYQEAQNEYLKLTNLTAISRQQKGSVYFKLGLCNYAMKLYDMASDSFIHATDYNINDAVAYNNAAVCAFLADNPEAAEKYQRKAISIMPVVEFHYNLARVYETLGKYVDSVKYYNAVVKGEENITKENRIDPVRIKNKVMQLAIKMSNYEEVSNELMVAYKLKDARELLVIDDADMEIKNKNFEWEISKASGYNRLYCSYDREKADPYNLINSLSWTVKSGGKTVYTGKKDDFTLSLNEGSNYIVYLDINYNGNKQASSYIDITKSNSMYSSKSSKATAVSPITYPSDGRCKYYEHAVYEQVFEKGFHISGKGYKDRFNTIWGKDNIEAKVVDKDFVDAQGALYINNTTSKRAGIWADLSSVINDNRLKGSTVSIKFYAKRVSDNANLSVIMKTKTREGYKPLSKKFQLEREWQRFSIDLKIPDDAKSLTMSLRTDAGEEIKLDGYIITLVK